MRRIAAGACLALAVALAGCAPAHDPALVREGAQRVFDGIVAELSALDAAAARTVVVSEPAEQACGEDGAGTQTALVATATMPVAADEGAAEVAADAAVAGLDPDVWDEIRPSAETTGQRAWASQDGVVVTITATDPLVVAAVFTPCRS